MSDNNTAGLAHSTESDTGDSADNSNLVLRCQFCKRHVSNLGTAPVLYNR